MQCPLTVIRHKDHKIASFPDIPTSSPYALTTPFRSHLQVMDKHLVSPASPLRTDIPLPAPFLFPNTEYDQSPVRTLKVPSPAPSPSSPLLPRSAGQPRPKRRPPPLCLVASPSPRPHGRSVSVETIKAVRPDSETGTGTRLPLTPFPPWRNSSGEEEEERWIRSRDCSRTFFSEGGAPCFRRSAAHAAFFAVQSVAIVGVVSVLFGLAVWKKHQFTDELWNW